MESSRAPARAHDPATELARGAARLGLALSPTAQRKLLDYLALLAKWNRVYNLTAVRDPGRMVTRHLLDSLAVAPHVAASTLLDVGSGAGLPGIPLALADPGLRVTLVDSSRKKAAFLRQVAIELAAANIEVVCERVETWHPGRLFEVVITRAFASLAGFAAAAGRLVAPGGRLAAMKGALPQEELARLPTGWRLERAIPLAVPGLAAPRHLILLERP
ncbi:MAG TPA: 16S rRNA (guanine(527)-N(7))-methyltransferase RsmG [Burkholderiales bacterium]|nr:16S rRNA (guanine(527)-N(7))-methyltransferase RsmG [Burkholderiales bacterium]